MKGGDAVTSRTKVYFEVELRNANTRKQLVPWIEKCQADLFVYYDDGLEQFFIVKVEDAHKIYENYWEGIYGREERKDKIGIYTLPKIIKPTPLYPNQETFSRVLGVDIHLLYLEDMLTVVHI